MEILNPELFHPANGHYSHAIEHNGLLYISGQLPSDPDNNQIPEGIVNQVQVVLDKLDSILIAAGSSRSKVIQVRIYITDVKLWSEVNKVYSEFFDTHKPVRTVIPVPELHFGALIELDALAVKS